MKPIKPIYLVRATPILLLAMLLIIGCKKEYSAEDVPIPPTPPVVKDHNLLIKFKAVVDTNDLVFGDYYTNKFDESYRVSAFKFYIHGIEMINTDSGKTYKASANNYYLVDFSDSLSTEIKLTVQPYLYNRIAFVVGVDSARNVSGAQTGALDPAKGMFWTWTTGYIMAKLEGISQVSPQSNKFEYHIGGFQEPNNVIKKITLLYPFGQQIDLKPEKSSEMTITANLNAWFNNPHDIRISVNPVCTTPGPLAKQIAENYSKMFIVTGIVNQ